MPSKTIPQIARELETAGSTIAEAAVDLGRRGHAKAKDLDRLRSRLNIIIRSLNEHGKTTAPTDTRSRPRRSG